MDSSAARSRSRSETPRMAVSGLFNSCATPASICPIAANFSVCWSCCSRCFSSVTSRADATAPMILPSTAIRVLEAVFEAHRRLLAAYHAVKFFLHARDIFRMGELADGIAQELRGRKADKLLAPRADKSEFAIGVERDDQVWETFHEPAAEFLLPLKAPLDFHALGDVHERALNPRDLACAVANRRAGIETTNLLAVFADQCDFEISDGAGFLELGDLPGAMRRIFVERRLVDQHQFFFVIVSQHFYERGIGFEHLAFRGAEVNAFLEGFE